MDKTTNDYPPPYSVTPGAPPPAGFVTGPVPTHNMGGFQQQPQSYPQSYPQGYPQGYPQQTQPQTQYVYQQPGTTVVHVAPVNTAGTSTVIIANRCPSCQVGLVNSSFTVCGLLCAIIFFPAGILCCLLMTQKRCSNCGAIYD